MECDTTAFSPQASFFPRLHRHHLTAIELFPLFRLSDFVRPPTLVSQISWVEQCWPRSLPSVGELRRPAVMKYCLMGTENSYTDFHIDFGGSSVWYHVLRVGSREDASCRWQLSCGYKYSSLRKLTILLMGNSGVASHFFSIRTADLAVPFRMWRVTVKP